MKEKIKIGYIGLGRRGYSMMKHCFSEMSDVEIYAICDLNPEKIQRACKMLEEKGRPTPKIYDDYHDLIRDPEVDAVLVMTGWDFHCRCALDSLRAGKYTGVEVGCAYNVRECFDLVDAHEQTGAHLMMLENCNYGRREMAVLRMVKEGLFGEIVHCDGAYHHYLPAEDLMHVNDTTGKIEEDHYRADEYFTRNCEQYPTHAFGPLAKVLDINRGNRIVSIASFASKAAALRQYMDDHVSPDYKHFNDVVRQGDVIDTILTCANGQTVRLTLDTTLPRPFYSREFTVRGTKGMSMEINTRDGFVYLEGEPGTKDPNETQYFEKYEHPLYSEYLSGELRGGHGGIDWLVCRAFVESVKAGVKPPIDTYDTVTWMAIAPLSEESIQKGGAPVAFPDFTRGAWIRPEPPVLGKYCLDAICSEPEIPIFPD